MSGSNYDVIIVGAGPAGSTAGYVLSSSGLNVLIIDKSTFPRKKLCAGLITHKTVGLLERIFGATVDKLKENNIINYEAGSYEVRDRKKLIAQRTFRIPFRFIDRYVYDNFLLQKTRQAGADIMEGEGVTSLDMINSSVTTSSGRRFKAAVIVGADGVNSRIRRSFMVELFGRNDWTKNTAAAHEIFVPRKAFKDQFEHPVLFFDYINKGYVWIFPGREFAKIGICGLRQDNNKDILTLFRDFLSEVNIVDITKHKISSYVLPYGNYLPSPVFKNVILTGDAAGFADPLLGEGIYYAHRSAEFATRAILETIGKDNHEERLKDTYLLTIEKHILPELIYAEKIRHVIFKYMKKFQWYPLKMLMSLFGNRPVETVHGLRSYKWMKKL